MYFRDRFDGGRQLSERLLRYSHDDAIVLALPRGGVIVGDAVAERLGAPLDVFVARKIGAPGHEELGIGAVAEGGEPIFDSLSLRRLGLTVADLDAAVERERRELQRRVERYRGDEEPPRIGDRVAIVVDDGLATGVTAHAALVAIRPHRPRRLVLAVPVAAPETVGRLADDADEIITVETPREFMAVGQWYADFAQTTDEEVLEVLRRARERFASGHHASGPPGMGR